MHIFLDLIGGVEYETASGSWLRFLFEVGQLDNDFHIVIELGWIHPEVKGKLSYLFSLARKIFCLWAIWARARARPGYAEIRISHDNQ